MWTKSGIESEGQYSVTQEISLLLRNILETDEKHQNWRTMISTQLKEQFMKVEDIPLQELDVIFSLITGGDFNGLQAGSHAITKDKQLVTIIGFSDKWNVPGQLVKSENDILKNLKVRNNVHSKDDKVVALYFDQAAKERQELMVLNIYDLTLLPNLDKDDQEKIAEMSILNDMEIVKHFIDTLDKLHAIPNSSLQVEQLIKKLQLSIQILKALTNMIQISGQNYIAKLQSEGILERLLSHLFTLQQRSNTDKKMLPLEWIELKQASLKRICLENDVSLIPNQNENTASIMNKKQIILQSNDPETGEIIIVNTQLLSAINLHSISSNQVFKCHLAKDLTDFTTQLEQDPEHRDIVEKKYGLVFCDGQDLEKLDNKALNILLNSQVVVTTNDIQPKEFFTKLVDLVKKDDEKEEKQRTLLGLLESVILIIRKTDYIRLQQPTQLQIKPQMKQAATPLEGLIKELELWIGLDKNTILYHLAADAHADFNIIAVKVLKLIQQLNDEKEKNKEKVKKLEVDKKFKEADQLKAKLAEQESKKLKELQEKLLKIKESGLVSDTNKSLVQQLSEAVESDQSQENYEKEITLQDLTKDDKIKKSIEKIITERIQPFRSDKLDDQAKEKSEKAQISTFYDAVLKIDKKSTPSEYRQNLQSLENLYSRKVIVTILANSNLNDFLKVVLKDKQSQKVFSCFLKTAFNDALLFYLSSGQKLQLNAIKSIISNLVKFCGENAEYTNFLQQFLRFDIIDNGLRTVESIKEKQPKSIKDYFSQEEKVLKELNPYLLNLFVELLIKDGNNLLTEKTIYIPALFNICLNMFVFFQYDESAIQNQLLTSIILLLKFLEGQLEAVTKNKSIEYLLNNNLLKLINEEMDYDTSDKFNNQQKLLLEIHMKLLDFHQIISENNYGAMDTNLETSQGILKLKRGQQVLKQKEQFDFIKYYIHQQNLDEYQLECLNQTIETNHDAFDTKILAKFSMKDVEKLTIKFNEKTKIQDFCFLGIASNASGKSIEYYTQENIKSRDKEVTLYRGDFYLFYPIKKQIIVAFGEGGDNRLGANSTTNTQPKAISSTSYIQPQKVLSSYTHSVLIDNEGSLFRAGQVKRSGSQNAEYNKVEFKEKIKLIALGKFNIIIVTEDNQIYRQGYSKDGHLGPNTDYSSLTKFEKVEDEEQITEKIVDVTSGTHFTLFVTESGKLYGIGNRFLKEIGLDCDQKIIPIPLKEGVKVLRAYASMGKKSPLAFLKVQLENREEQFWSAGKSEQGLLGQGPLVKTSKIFRPIKYDHIETKFVDFSLHSDHAVAIDQEGNLWSWGSNISKRAGFKEDIYDGVFEPKKLQFPIKDKFRALRVSAGFDHTLVLFEDENQDKKLYSIGQDETNYHHLGITQQEAEDKSVFYREVTAFRGFNIVDFTAGHRSSHVIIEGDKEPTDSLYSHKFNGTSKQGLLHFYQDENKQWHYVSQDEYEAKKDQLPDLCFATKCPISELETKEFPDLVELQKVVFDNEAKDNIHPEVNDSVIKNEINGPRYFSYSKINGDKQKINLSEQTIQIPNIYDINPLVYYRIKKPLHENARLPILDSKQYFKESSAYGLDIEIVPDLSYKKNQSLIDETKSIYNENLELFNKFLPELDTELLREMDKYVKNTLSDKNLQEIKAKTDFKIGDMAFKNPKFKKMTENVKRKRIEQYLTFNQIFLDIMPFISLDDNVAGGDMAQAFQEVKSMILFNMKNKFLSTFINTLPTGSQAYCEIRRRKAQRFCEGGKVDHKGEHTIFGQIFQTIKQSGYGAFQQNGTDAKVYSAKLIGEGSIDAGGPYRETLTNICDELESEHLPLLIKTPNNRNNHGENRDCFIPNMASNNPTHLEMFKFLGCFLGYAIRTLCPLMLHFPPIFWKQILKDKLTLQDLKGFDTYSWQIIEDLKKQSKKLSDQEFEAIVEETFVTRLSDGSEVQLKEGGKSIRVTKENLQEYIDLILEKRFTEYDNQIAQIREGIDFVIPLSNLKIYTWEEVETRACGDKILDIEKLKKITEYYSCKEDNEFVQRFWRVLAELTDEEQQLYLKFVWGRARLPYDTSRLRDNHTIYLCRERSDKDFPEAHTWQYSIIFVTPNFSFFQLDLPQYTTDEICKKRLVTAITMCGEIDTDGSAQYIPDDNDQD